MARETYETLFFVLMINTARASGLRKTLFKAMLSL